MLTTLKMLTLTAQCTCTGHLSPRDVLRMLAYGVLAVQAGRARDGNLMTYKMHVGAMRGTWRRARVRAIGCRAVAQALGV